MEIMVIGSRTIQYLEFSKMKKRKKEQFDCPSLEIIRKFLFKEVRMVTSDNPQTAKAIALECGILSSDEDAVEPNINKGRVFREYSDAKRERITEKILADNGLSMEFKAYK